MSPIFNSAILLIGLLGSISTIIGTIFIVVDQYRSRKGRAGSKLRIRQWKITRLISGAVLILIFGLIGIVDTSTYPHPLPPSFTSPTPPTPIGVLLYRFTSDDTEASSLAWSPDSTRIASVDKFNGTIHVFDALTGQHTLTYQPPSTAVSSLSWSPDGKYIAADVSGHLYILEVDQNLLKRVFVLDSPLLSRGNNNVAWSPDGTHIAIACSDNSVRVWNTNLGMVATDKNSLTFRHHAKEVFALAWSPNGQSIASVSTDQTIQIWNINDVKSNFRTIKYELFDGSTLSSFNSHPFTLYSNIVWSSDGDRIATENVKGIVSVWSNRSGANLFNINTNADSFEGNPVAWSPDSQYLATVSIEKDSAVIQVVDGDPNSPTKGFTLFIIGLTSGLTRALAWSPNEEYLAVASSGGVVVWKGRETIKETISSSLYEHWQDLNLALILIEFTGMYLGIGLTGYALLQFLPSQRNYIPYPPSPIKVKNKKILLKARNILVQVIIALLLITFFYVAILATYIPFNPTTFGLSAGFSINISTFIVYTLPILFSSSIQRTRIYLKKRRYFRLGWTFMSKNDYHQAIECYDRLIALDPNNSGFYNNRGLIYSMLKEDKTAIEDYSRAIELDPTLVPSYHNRAYVHLQQGEYQMAIEDYNHAITLAPDNPTLYLERALAYLWLRSISLAKTDYLLCHELDSKNIRAAWMLVWIEMNKQRPDYKTAELLEKLAKIRPKHYETYICRGVALGIRGKVSEGLKEVERALLLEPEKWDAYFWKAMLSAYYYQGQSSAGKTKTLIEKSLQLGLPPILLTPLYWLEKDRPKIFESCAELLLLKYEI